MKSPGQQEFLQQLLVPKQEILFLQEGAAAGRDAGDASVPGVTQLPFWSVIKQKKINPFSPVFLKKKANLRCPVGSPTPLQHIALHIIIELGWNISPTFSLSVV